MHYLDNAATTAPFPEAVRAANDILCTHFANPSSLYALGLAAEQVIDDARAVVAAAMGCEPKQVIFTASGSEANNIAIQGIAQNYKNRGNHMVVTGYEHPSVYKVALMLAQRDGFEVTFVPPDLTGRIQTADLVKQVREDTILVCAMQVNNETGAVIDVAGLAALVKAKNPRTAVHVDAVQGFCKLPLVLGETQIDSAAVAGHKIHAPKGVGALYLRKGFSIVSPLQGGGQENGLRPGTENIAYIAAFSEAVTAMLAKRVENTQTVHMLRELLLEGLGKVPEVLYNSPADGYPGILNVALPGIRSETMLHFLEERQVYVSSGSACTKGKASHTLTAMNLQQNRIDSSLRISFDGTNSAEDIRALVTGLEEGWRNLARKKGAFLARG